MRPEGGDVAYNLDDCPPNPSPKEYCQEHTLRDGTYIIFPFDLDDPNTSNELSSFGGPPALDSDGNEVHSDDSDESLSSGGPPDLDSNGNEVHSEVHSDESSEGPLSIDSGVHVIFD